MGAASASAQRGERATDGKRSRGGTWVLVTTTIVLLLPLLYVLSIGPVARCAAARPDDDHAALERFYAPVVWLHDHTFLEQPLEWYVNLWL